MGLCPFLGAGPVPPVDHGSVLRPETMDTYGNPIQLPVVVQRHGLPIRRYPSLVSERLDSQQRSVYSEYGTAAHCAHHSPRQQTWC